jgi:hypothetical protein
MAFSFTHVYVIRGIEDFTLCESRAEKRLALLLPYQRSHLPPGRIRRLDGYRRFSQYLGDGVAGTANLARPRSKKGLEAAEYDVGHGSYWCVTLENNARLQGSSARLITCDRTGGFSGWVLNLESR